MERQLLTDALENADLTCVTAEDVVATRTSRGVDLVIGHAPAVQMLRRLAGKAARNRPFGDRSAARALLHQVCSIRAVKRSRPSPW